MTVKQRQRCVLTNITYATSAAVGPFLLAHRDTQTVVWVCVGVGLPHICRQQAFSPQVT